MTSSQSEAYRHLVSTIETGTVDVLRRLLQDLGADRLDLLNAPVGDEASPLPPLFVAVSSGDPAKVDLLIEGGARLDVRDENGVRPIDRSSSLTIYLTCLARQPELALDQVFTDGDHAIHQFARRGAADIVAYQLDHGVPIGVRGRERNTVLHYAAASRDAGFVRMLIERGAKLEARNAYAFRPLHRAAETGSVEVVRALVEAGAKLNPKTSVSFIIQETRTPLYLAIEARHLNVARHLLECGADPNVICDTSHNSALTAACGNDDPEAVALLLRHGARPNGLQLSKWPDFNSFPLGEARSAEIVDLLVAAGADVNARQRYGDTALHVLVSTSSMMEPGAIRKIAAAIEALIRHGADPHASGAHGLPPAMFAKNAAIASALAGGPATKPADLGRLLLEAARDMEKEPDLDLLLDLLRHADAGDVNVSRDFIDSEGETILMRVVKAMDDPYREPPLTRYVDIANRLLDLGAEVDAVETLFGENVLHKLCRIWPDSVSAADAVLIEAVADRLIAAGVPVNLENDEGSHALDFVRWIGLFHLLQSHGATLGRTHVALFAAMDTFARGAGTPDEVDALLAAGVPIEARSPRGDTPFLFAARLDSILLLDHLAHLGADVHARGANDATALHIACSVTAMNAAEWLVVHGAPLDAHDAEGRTPLELAKTKTIRTKLARIAKSATPLNHGRSD